MCKIMCHDSHKLKRLGLVYNCMFIKWQRLGLTGS
jgi:hypothetical protein